MERKLDGTLTFVALVSVSVAVEAACAWLAYHTIGEIPGQGMMLLAVGLNALAIMLYAAGRRSVAVIATLMIFLVIAPYQAVLGHRLLSLQQESASLVSHLYEVRLRTGEFPADLSGYTFQVPQLKAHFYEYIQDSGAGGFRLSWYVSTPSTSHFYTPSHGWSYYPD